jgi:phosphonate transport system substrate-binding protein
VKALNITTCQAENAEPVCAALAGYLSARLEMEVRFISDIPWQERERRFDAGEIDLVWICGLPYVDKADRGDTIELLAAPVMAGERYGGKPVYFSDLVVRADRPWRSLDDLRGASWAYNEPHSHSGFSLIRAELARRGEGAGYFSRVIESGAHQTALRWVAEGAVDGTAIDSTVLETELRRDPGLRGRIRIIATLGPSPIPPWLVRRALPAPLRSELRRLFLEARDDSAGRAALETGAMRGFAAVRDEDYGPIRATARLAAGIGRWPS